MSSYLKARPSVELAFEELGQVNSNAIPLIILHGFFASSRNWRQVAEKLAVKQHVYVVDMRNHGASPHHINMDYPDMVVDLLAFMDAQGIKQASLLGHSMGGKVAMWCALKHPERIDKLLVADIAPVRYEHSFNALITALKSLPLQSLKNRKEAEQWLEPDIPELTYRQFLLQNLVLIDGEYTWRVDLDIFYATGDNIIGFPDVKTVKPYQGAALFLAGGNSNYVRKEQLDELFPQAQLSVIADAGHWLHVQQPVEFLKRVESFLS